MYNYFYKITNNINGKFYYGVHSTNNLDDGYMGSGSYIKNAIKKYGIENFKKEILKFFENIDEMFDYESQLVNNDLVNNPNCYNLVNGGDGYRIGHTCPGIIRSKISLKAKGRSSKNKGKIYVNKDNVNKMIFPEELDYYTNNGWNKGIYLSEESRIKLITCPMKGKKYSLEHRKKLSDIKKRLFKEGKLIPHNKGVPISEEVKQRLREINTGKKHTLESRQKISLSKTGKKHDKTWNTNISNGLKGHNVSKETRKKIGISNGKKVIRINPNTNERYTYNSISEAEKDMGYKKGAGCIKKAVKTGKICKGYIWELQII